MKTIYRLALLLAALGICFDSSWLRAEEDLGAISEERELWPSEVVLNQDYRLELSQAGGATGSIQLPKGVKLVLRAVEPDGLEVEFAGTRFKVQPSFTDFDARVAAKRKALSLSQMPSVEANETTIETPLPVSVATNVATPTPGLTNQIAGGTNRVAGGTSPTAKGVFANLSAGKLFQFSAPLSEKNQRLSAKGVNEKLESAKIGIYVPPNFKPDQTWPVLVVSATSNASSIDLAQIFKDEALNKGWVVIAADWPAKPKSDPGTLRIAMILTGLETMHAEWPGSEKWPVACGGFSGGAKYSGLVAAGLGHEGYRIIGMFMVGCNEDMATKGLKEFHPPAARFKAVPIFLSSGKSDTVATPQHHQNVQASIKKNGFRHIRIESFDGGHQVWPQHIGMALDWFQETATKKGTSS